MPTPIVPIALGLVGLVMLAQKRGSSGGNASLEAEQLFATAMSTGIKSDAGALELYAQKCDKLGRSDLAYQLRKQMLLSTPDGAALQLYTTAMSPAVKMDVGALESFAQRIEALGVRPDLVAAIRAQKSSVLTGLGK